MNYADRFAFVENSAYGKQVSTALWIAASEMLAKSPTADQTAWAKLVLRGPAPTDTQRLVMIRVASSDALDSVKVGQPLPDELIQQAVDTIVPDLITAMPKT